MYLVHEHELPALIRALQVLAKAAPASADASTRPKPKRAGLSLQDAALCLLADGYGPRDLPARLWPGEEPNQRRLTELGKALRRAGLVVPGDWEPTAQGLARAADLKALAGGRQGEARATQGDPPVNGEAAFPPFPR